METNCDIVSMVCLLLFRHLLSRSAKDFNLRIIIYIKLKKEFLQMFGKCLWNALRKIFVLLKRVGYGMNLNQSNTAGHTLFSFISIKGILNMFCCFCFFLIFSWDYCLEQKLLLLTNFQKQNEKKKKKKNYRK